MIPANHSDNGQYEVTIIDNLPGTRAITDQVQGIGKYPEGKRVTLFTNGQKFRATASGTNDGSFSQPDTAAIQP